MHTYARQKAWHSGFIHRGYRAFGIIFLPFLVQVKNSFAYVRARDISAYALPSISLWPQMENSNFDAPLPGTCANQLELFWIFALQRAIGIFGLKSIKFLSMIQNASKYVDCSHTHTRTKNPKILRNNHRYAFAKANAIQGPAETGGAIYRHRQELHSDHQRLMNANTRSQFSEVINFAARKQWTSMMKRA